MSCMRDNDTWTYQVLVFRQVLETVSRYMDEIVYRSTVAYQQKQRCQTVRRMRGGAVRGPEVLQFHAVESATHSLENALFKKLALLNDSDDLWRDLVPVAARSRKLCALAHRLISGVECWVEIMVVDNHMKCPTRR